jgi:hypothetical protein
VSKSTPSNRRRRKRQLSERRFKPSFERLEDRSLLTIVFTPFYGLETQSKNDGAVVPDPPVYLIFWGSYWIQGNGPEYQQQLIYGAQGVLNSSFLQGTKQYRTSGTATYAPALATMLTGEPANGFHTTQLEEIEHDLAEEGYIPHGNEATPTPIFAIITPPGIRSEEGNVAVGYNDSFSPDGESADFPTLWCSSGNLDGSAPSGGQVNVDAFTHIFSHEIAECMTDLGQGGFEVNPGPNFPNPPPNESQIGDYEANGHEYREYTGALVQSIWSRDDNAFIVADGNTQQFILTTRASGGYDLTLNGDQPGHSDDIFYIDTVGTFNDEVKAVINSEVAVFEPGSIHSITINTLGGTNTVYVAQTTVPVTIHGNPSDTVKIGVDGSVQGIKASVDVSERVHTIEVDDSTDATAQHPVFGSGGIVGLLPNNKVISYAYGVNGADQNLTVDTGTGASTVDVYDTIKGGSVTLNTVAGTHAVNVQYVAPTGPLRVNLAGGVQDVNISPGAKDLSMTLFAEVTVNPGTGTSILNIDDDNATVVRRYTIDAGVISTDIAGTGVIHYGRLSDVNLNGGYHGNTFTVQNTLNLLPTNLNTQAGDTVNVLGTADLSTVNVEGGPSLMVNVGNGGHAASLQGLLQIDAYETSLTVDDSGDLNGQNDVVLQPTSVTGITGLNDGIIEFAPYAIAALTIKGSQGGSVYHVAGTPIPFPSSSALTTLICGGGDTVTVGNYHAGNLTGIHSDLTIENPDHFTNLTIDASADVSSPSSPTTATITNAAVSGLSPGAIRFDQSALSSLTIDGEPGGATYDIQSLPTYFSSTMTTTLNALAGDTVNLGQNHSLVGAWGTGNLVCSFSGSGSAAKVVLDGNQDPAGATYTIGGNNNLTALNATVGLGLTINGFRDQDQVVIDLPGGSVNADLTHTGPGTISLDGSDRLLGTNVAAPLNTTIHARTAAGTIMPAGPITGVLHVFNSVYFVGSMPQDTLHVYDATNSILIDNDPVPAPFAQFAAASGDPMTVTAGQPFDFTVIAQDNTGATLANYNNQVQWYSYNRATGDYSSSNYEQFMPADQGQHVFHNLVLPVAGTYTLGFDDGWNVSSFTINVVAPPQEHASGLPGDAGPAIIPAAASSVLPAAAEGDVIFGSIPAVDPLTTGSDQGRQLAPATACDNSHQDASPSVALLSARADRIATPGAERHDSPAAINSIATSSALSQRLPGATKPLWTEALDKCFEHYQRRPNSRSPKSRNAEASSLSSMSLHGVKAISNGPTDTLDESDERIEHVGQPG